MNAMRVLSGDHVGLADQLARSAPRGSLVGFATHPSRFGGVPLTSVTASPPSEISSSLISTPLSSGKFVSFTGRYSGAAAANTFRWPRSYDHHAMRSTFFADTRSCGYAGLRN